MARISSLALAFTVLFSTLSSAGEVRTAQPGQTPPKASVADLAWIEGSWSGTGLGGAALVVYSAPFDGQIVGHFRQAKGDKIQFYEIATIAEVAGSLEYRVKHFGPDLTGWEDKATVVKFPLVAVEEDVWYFDGLTVRKSADGGLIETVLIEQKDGKPFEAPFTYARTRN